MRILISACLLGLCCRYDGGSKPCGEALALSEKYELIPVCPEQLGGLPTPRPPCERVGDRVMSSQGADRTAEYGRGAQQAWQLYQTMRCDCALLKARSPMCGNRQVYDGTFSGTLRDGSGVLAELLMQNGVTVYSEEDLDGNAL